MNAPPSRYLARLDEDISKAGETVDADCLRAEKAAYLARQGRLEEARRLIDTVRQSRRVRGNFLASAWISLAEGLSMYFSEISLGARDKMLRAQAYSGSAGLRRLDALCSAWLAQMDYSSLDPDAMMRNIRRAFAAAAMDHHAARGRASLVLAQSLHYARRFDLASPWYERARRHALSEGDDATISAIMHNMAWLRMGSLRQAVHRGEERNSDGTFALIGHESMRSFDAMIGAASFKELDPLLRAETLALDDRPAEALPIYVEHLGRTRMIGTSRWLSVFLADRAWCHARTGDLGVAAIDGEAAEAALSPETQIDDRAATHSRLAHVFAMLRNEQKAAIHLAAAQQTWRDVESLQMRFVELAGIFVDR